MDSSIQDQVLSAGSFNYSPLLGIVTGVTFALATIFVVLRIISRIHIARHFAADDWLIVISWALALGFNVVCWVALGQGFGSAPAVASHVKALPGDLFAFAILYVRI